jgi:hypothetical protein
VGHDPRNPGERRAGVRASIAEAYQHLRTLARLNEALARKLNSWESAPGNWQAMRDIAAKATADIYGTAKDDKRASNGGAPG